MTIPTAVSTKHMQTLEAAVGDKLVEGHGRASRLTESGRVVPAYATRMVDTIEGMEEELRDAARATLRLRAT